MKKWYVIVNSYFLKHDDSFHIDVIDILKMDKKQLKKCKKECINKTVYYESLYCNKKESVIYPTPLSHFQRLYPNGTRWLGNESDVEAQRFIQYVFDESLRKKHK